jgi:uncharacterized OB-fold protein
MSEIHYPPGTVYPQTTVWSAPESFADDAPYQVAIITPNQGGPRLTVRILGETVQIGDRVHFQLERAGIPFYTRSE